MSDSEAVRAANVASRAPSRASAGVFRRSRRLERSGRCKTGPAKSMTSHRLRQMACGHRASPMATRASGRNCRANATQGERAGVRRKAPRFRRTEPAATMRVLASLPPNARSRCGVSSRYGLCVARQGAGRGPGRRHRRGERRWRCYSGLRTSQCPALHAALSFAAGGGQGSGIGVGQPRRSWSAHSSLSTLCTRSRTDDAWFTATWYPHPERQLTWVRARTQSVSVLHAKSMSARAVFP